MIDLKEISERLKKEGENGELYINLGIPTFFVKNRYPWMSEYNKGWQFVSFTPMWFTFLEKDNG